MSILLAATLWVVNRQIARELQNNAASQLLVAEAVFKNSEQIRANHLLLRYKSIADEPKFKALAKLGDPATLKGPLNELLESHGGDYAQFMAFPAKTVSGTGRHQDFPESLFAEAAAGSIQKALDGVGNTGLVRVRDDLYDVISVPVNVSGDVIGVFTFAI